MNPKGMHRGTRATQHYRANSNRINLQFAFQPPAGIVVASAWDAMYACNVANLLDTKVTLPSFNRGVLLRDAAKDTGASFSLFRRQGRSGSHMAATAPSLVYDCSFSCICTLFHIDKVGRPSSDHTWLPTGN